MKPYYFSINDHVVSLYPLGDRRYQMIEQGTIGCLMVGFKYVLVNEELSDFLKSLNIENISFKDAIIWNRKKDKEYKYQNITVFQHFMSDQINDINLDGNRFLIMDNQYLFVSPALKLELENSAFNFTFSEGLSQFS